MHRRRHGPSPEYHRVRPLSRTTKELGFTMQRDQSTCVRPPAGAHPEPPSLTHGDMTIFSPFHGRDPRPMRRTIAQAGACDPTVGHLPVSEFLVGCAAHISDHPVI